MRSESGRRSDQKAEQDPGRPEEGEEDQDDGGSKEAHPDRRLPRSDAGERDGHWEENSVHQNAKEKRDGSCLKILLEECYWMLEKQGQIDFQIYQNEKKNLEIISATSS